MDDETQPTETAASDTGGDGPRFPPPGTFVGMPLSDSPNYVPSHVAPKTDSAPAGEKKKERTK